MVDRVKPKGPQAPIQHAAPANKMTEGANCTRKFMEKEGLNLLRATPGSSSLDPKRVSKKNP